MGRCTEAWVSAGFMFGYTHLLLRCGAVKNLNQKYLLQRNVLEERRLCLKSSLFFTDGGVGGVGQCLRSVQPALWASFMKTWFFVAICSLENF